MKAIIFEKYGSPDVLQRKEVEKPTPGDNEVLIKINATTVNRTDCAILRAKPFFSRIITGLLKPKKPIPGTEFAGKIEAVGKNVLSFKTGDKVFGFNESGFGCHAQYMTMSEDKALTTIPENITYEQAAASTEGAFYAYNFINKVNLKSGQKVLVNGAGGCVGVFAIQLAKMFGAEVTGVDTTSKQEMMRSLGADHVIDFTKEDFTKNGQHYDFILDVVAYRSIFDYMRALSSKGAYYMVGGSMAVIFQVLLLGPLIRLFGGKKIAILGVLPNTEDLRHMADLFEAGKVIPVIDRHYPLDKVPEALRYFGEGHPKGKVIITVEHNNKT